MVQKVKKPTKQQHAKHQKRHRIIVGLSVVVVAVLLGLIFSLIFLPKIHDDMRLHRINGVYSAIKLPANLYYETDNIFGDRRMVGTTPDVTESSSKSFVVAKTVTETFGVIDQAIRDSGAVAIKQTNSASVSQQATYRTSEGAYIHLNVESKLRLDAFQNTYWMQGDSSAFTSIDPNAGPSLVTLKVNLDDNNE